MNYWMFFLDMFPLLSLSPPSSHTLLSLRLCLITKACVNLCGKMLKKEMLWTTPASNYQEAWALYAILLFWGEEHHCSRQYRCCTASQPVCSCSPYRHLVHIQMGYLASVNIAEADSDLLSSYWREFIKTQWTLTILHHPLPTVNASMWWEGGM